MAVSKWLMILVFCAVNVNTALKVPLSTSRCR